MWYIPAVQGWLEPAQVVDWTYHKPLIELEVTPVLHLYKECNILSYGYFMKLYNLLQ
jgi:hypothetical protein